MTLLSAAAPLPTAAAEPDPPSAVAAKMEEFVATREIAGAVTLVATREKVVRVDAVGQADLAAQQPMREDALFWIASMTKPVTGTAVMMLVEEGKLSLDDPVEKHLPELAALRFQDKPVKMTIRHLLTHTSGLADARPEESRAFKTLQDTVANAAGKPVQFEPGSKWSYCQSSINAAARIVEVISGKSFPDFLDERLFQPLGMKDTTFYLSTEQVDRLAKSYARTTDGKLEPAAVFLLQGNQPTNRERYPAANGGLFSTARDYGQFCRMILRGGELDGRRYLKHETVKQMTAIHTAELTTGFTTGNGWGIGWCVVRKPQGNTAILSPGSHGHGGAYGTQAWIDPEKNAAYVLMVQRANFPNADDSPVRKAFQESAAKLLGK